MKYRKFNKYEKKEVRAAQLAKALHGEGLYLYENHTKADLTLPRPTPSGVRTVNAGQQFQGDNYYMQLVKTGELRLIKELLSPQQEKENEMVNEEKLVLDQPDRVTAKGKVEQVVDTSTPTQPMNEEQIDEATDVLLNEGPTGFVIVTD
jgi:hypothetical protein